MLLQIGPLKKSRLSRANLPWIELTTFPYHYKPHMPLRVLSLSLFALALTRLRELAFSPGVVFIQVLRVAGHPQGRKSGADRTEYVNIAPALEEVDLNPPSLRHGTDHSCLHKEWRWICSDCSTKLQVPPSSSSLRPLAPVMRD
jgi:hypothetical protein